MGSTGAANRHVNPGGPERDGPSDPGTAPAVALASEVKGLGTRGRTTA